MKITEKELQEAVEAVVKETYDNVARVEKEYTNMILDALKNRTKHLHEKFPDLAKKELQWSLAHIIGRFMFNNKKDLPKQFNRS
jgi:hypothetical protein